MLVVCFSFLYEEFLVGDARDCVLDCLLLIVVCIYALFAFLFVERLSLCISLITTAYSLLCLLVFDVLKIFLSILLEFLSFQQLKFGSQINVHSI